MADFTKSLSNMPEERLFRVGLTGTGAANPTRRAGAGVTVTRTAAGVLKFSFNDNPGTFVGIAGWTLRADTMSGVKGYSLSGGAYTAPASSVDGYVSVSLWDASNAAVDLAAAQYLDITFVFSTQNNID